MYKIKKTRNDRIFEAFITIICVMLAIAIIYPLYFVVIASFSDPFEVRNGHVWLYPVKFTAEGYRLVLGDSSVWTGYYNTIMYTAGATLVSLLVTIPAAYALSRPECPFRRIFNIFFLITMFFNGGIVPTYLLISSLNMRDTYWVMVIPFCLSVFNLIVARTFFTTSIPMELIDAAHIDGCSNTRLFLQIVLPLSGAIIAVIGLYVAVANWNSYFNALIYLMKEDKKPLQIVLRNILIKNEETVGGGWSDIVRRTEMIKYAIILVATVPIMCAYPLIQKYFTKGVMLGSLKG